MHKTFIWISIMVFAFAEGCSKEQSQPTDAKSSASQPAPSAASDAITPKGPRKYQPMPDSLLSPPSNSTATAFSEWALVQEELAKGSLDEAIRAYDRIKSAFPSENRLCAVTALQLSDALIHMAPPDLVRARALLKALGENKDSLSGDKRLRLDYDRQCLLADFAEARKVLDSTDAEFTEWLGRIISRVEKLDGSVAIERDLLRRVDYILGSTGPMDGVVADRMEAILVGLQASVAWHSPDILRALQERRIQLLSDAKRPAEAIYEARLLMALSTNDVKVWIASQDKVKALMGAAGQDDKSIAGFVEYQQYGPEGADGRKGTGDDIVDPLAGSKRDVTKLCEVAGVTGRRQDSAAAQDSAAGEGIRRGVGLLLAGRGNEAKECISKLYQPASEMTSPQIELALKYLGAANAYCDGHWLGCDKCAADVVAAIGKAESPAAKMWRYAAIGYQKQREALLDDLVVQRRADRALGLCRALAENDCLPKRLDVAMNQAWSACEVKGDTLKVEVAMPLFMDFGKALTNPRARIRHVQLAANMYREVGDEASILPAIEGLKDIWDLAANDPDLVLLRSSSLVRLGRSSEALPELLQLVQRSDLPPDRSWRGQLLLGVAYVQEGQLAKSREVLHRLLDEHPNEEYRNKVMTVLSNIPM